MLRDKTEHVDISNFLQECKARIQFQYDNYDEDAVTMFDQPVFDPGIATKYINYFAKSSSMLSEFLKASNIPLRMIRSENTAIVTYKIVVPETLRNVLVLDASYPIRELCQHDANMQPADSATSGVKPFHLLKRFDAVDLYRLKTYGGRGSMEKRFRDKKMLKEVVEVLKTIPPHEAVLMYVYKKRDCVAPGGAIDYQKLLLAEIRQAGISTAGKVDGKPRLIVETWGNETSLNCYAHCKHVFLVGILHRDETELLGQYLGQIDDIAGEISAVFGKVLQRSEKAHLAYQALSRGTCRVIDDGQAGAMKGYIVEVDPLIEEILDEVMPGARWHTWEAKYIAESGNLVGTWAQRIQDYLNTLPESVWRVSSRSLKMTLKAGRVCKKLWARAIQEVGRHETERRHGSKINMRDVSFQANEIWYLEKASLVRKSHSAEAHGFKEEVGYVA